MDEVKEASRKRPSLSEQLDRLDRILDGLAGALNESVADAVKAAVGPAAQEAVRSALADGRALVPRPAGRTRRGRRAFVGQVLRGAVLMAGPTWPVLVAAGGPVQYAAGWVRRAVRVLAQRGNRSLAGRSG